MSRFRVFARVGLRSSAGVGACRLSVGASNSSSFFTCYHRYRGVHNMKTKPFIESSNLPSVASGFPRPGGNDGPRHFSATTVAAAPGPRRFPSVVAADGRHARRPLIWRPASPARGRGQAFVRFLARSIKDSGFRIGEKYSRCAPYFSTARNDGPGHFSAAAPGPGHFSAAATVAAAAILAFFALALPPVAQGAV
ncbi:MAG: hypothetical protein OXU62_13420, partial [Gammaproteobacteria bacterium]|nr:hypothetical protein [Gammaproteobacteria bacterium]